MSDHRPVIELQFRHTPLALHVRHCPLIGRTLIGAALRYATPLAFEGAEGAEKIRRLADSYNANPPESIDGSRVVTVKDFSSGEVPDAEGDLLPKEKLTIFELADARRIAVRPSGTEPKIKFYLFGRNADVSSDSLNQVKAMLADALESLWAWLQDDAKARVG